MKEAEGSEEYAALVGIDWGEKKRDVCPRAAGSERTEHWVVQHTPDEPYCSVRAAEGNPETVFEAVRSAILSFGRQCEGKGTGRANSKVWLFVSAKPGTIVLEDSHHARSYR